MAFHVGLVPLVVYFVGQYSVCIFADVHLNRSNGYRGNSGLSSANTVVDLLPPSNKMATA